MAIKKIISFPYQLAHALCSWSYDAGIFKKKRLPVYTISVGNISFGGTGKTPFTIELAKYLCKHGFRVAVLTRGYKASSSLLDFHPLLLQSGICESLAAYTEIPPGDRHKTQNLDFDAAKVGDEAYLMWQEFRKCGLDIPVLIDKDRFRAGMAIIRKAAFKQGSGYDVFILDDGLQHLALERDLDIVLHNVNEQGFFREFASAEADFVVYTKVSDEWIKKNPDKNYLKYQISLGPLDLKKGVYAFSAIADSRSFFQELENLLKARLAENIPNTSVLADRGSASSQPQLDSTPNMSKQFIFHPDKDPKLAFTTKTFPDHHLFSGDEVRKLLSTGMNLVCTPKDYVKIPDAYKTQVLSVDLVPEFGSGSLLESIVRRINHVRTFKCRSASEGS
jgi:tetraacyldisaccharide-1-P 4'-kinase